MNKYMVKFEVMSLVKNFFLIFFGLIFPILMTWLILEAFAGDIPDEYYNQATSNVVLTTSIISSLACFLIGLASTFSTDLEEGVYDRLELFGIGHMSMAGYKFLAYFVFWIICNIFYFAIINNYFDIDMAMTTLLKHTGYVSLVSITCFFFAYGLSLLTKKFSVTFGISLGLYFVIMILGGMMGIPVDSLPGGIKTFAKILPTSHFSSMDYLDEVAVGGPVNKTFLIRLLIFLGLSFIFFLIGMSRSRKKINS